MSRWLLATRTAARLAELADALAPSEIAVVAYPVLRELEFDDPDAWRRVLPRLDELGLLALTSPRATAGLRRGAEPRGVWPALRALPVAAVGEATARAAREAGLSVGVVGDAGGGDLARAILAYGVAGGVLHACGRDHRDELAKVLSASGVEVLSVPVYALEPTPLELLPVLPATMPVAVLLSSPRATRAYHVACGRRFARVPHLAFGATTAAAAAELGIQAVALPAPTAACIVEELCQNC